MEADSRQSRRTYNEYCAVAKGLDVIGDRWSLLLARELLLGPKRYKDLLAALPGIGTNLLAQRLRELERVGVVGRATLPPPAGSSVYRLTPHGEALQPVVGAIGRWGAAFLGAPEPDDVMVPGAYFVAMRHSFKSDRAGDLAETYELHVDGRVFAVQVQNSACTTAEAPASAPDAVFRLDVQTLNALLLEGLDPDDAVAQGRVDLSGDSAALRRFIHVFVIRDPKASTLGARST